MIDALEELEDFLTKVISRQEDLEEALKLAGTLSNAAQKDEDLKEADALDARRGRDRRQAADRRRIAMDERGSQLTKLLAQFPNPGRPIAGH